MTKRRVILWTIACGLIAVGTIVCGLIAALFKVIDPSTQVGTEMQINDIIKHWDGHILKAAPFVRKTINGENYWVTKAYVSETNLFGVRITVVAGYVLAGTAIYQLPLEDFEKFLAGDTSVLSAVPDLNVHPADPDPADPDPADPDLTVH